MAGVLKKLYSFNNLIERQINVLITIKPLYYSTSSTENSSENNHKVLRVSVIGVPNAGKSTFINNLINHRVCPTSQKVHTTRRSNKAIFTEKNKQIVFYDTPGLVTQSEIKKYNLSKNFSSSYRDSIQNSDMIAVVHDVSNNWTRNSLHSTVLETLNFYSNLPSFLILNKIDLLKSKRLLLDLIKVLTNDTLSKSKRGALINKKEIKSAQEDSENSKIGWSNFSNIFMVSSITGDGLNEIMKMLLQQAKNGEWLFSAQTFTDEKPEDIIVDSVRARLLDYLPQEIPYKLQTNMEYFCNDKNTIYASVHVLCPNLRLERLLCGESNGKLRQITERVTSDLVQTFNKRISLTITTDVSKSSNIIAN